MSNMKDKTILFVILFLIFISMHMQFPVFTPLAVSLGAGSFLIGVMLSTTSFVNLTGNIVAGSYIDRFGAKWFIVIPLFLLSISLFSHTFIEKSSHLFFLRVVNGFILAFLTPACMTMLASFAKSSQKQSKNMAMNTLIVTLAMTVAPLIGGFLGERFGADGAYYAISFTTAVAFILSLFFLNQPSKVRPVKKETGILAMFLYPPLLPVFLTGFAIMFAQGTLMYELPFLSVEQGVTKGTVGLMAAFMGIGTLIVLSLVFLHKLPAKFRAVVGLFMMAGALVWIMFSGSIPTKGSLILFGAASGVIMPAMMTLVTEAIEEGNRGKAFAFLSAVFSVGTISSPFIAAAVRTYISPYFVAWVVMMFVIMFIGLVLMNSQKHRKTIQS
ncbi:MFS family permease [Evansella vedderi]|uniref:MFS family permease n=2 Tax=Evansella vedderi TaxID=38282 RepID=A0ABT9ZSL8_9BACI|nr:MFS family permease [Evansella vedderi]